MSKLNSRVSASRYSVTGLGSCMDGFPEQTADRTGKALPERAFIRQRTAAAPRQRIYAPLSSRLASRPAAAEQSRLLKTMEHRVDRTFRQIECATTATVNLLNDSVTMRRAGRQRSKHDHVQMAF